MIRREWRDVLEEQPPISRNILVAEVDEPTRRKLDIFAGQLKTERTNTAANLALYRSKLSTIKLKVVLEEASRIRERDEPLVIWTWHKEFAKQIADRLDGRS